MSVGVQGKAVYAGTTRTAQGGALAFGAKARANPPDSLTGTLSHPVGARWPTGLSGWLAAFDRGHEEGLLTIDQGPNDLDAGKATIEQEDPDLDSERIETVLEALEYLIHGHLGTDATQRQGIALAADDGIGRGIREEMGCALFRFASANFILMGLVHGAMIGQFDQIDGDATAPFAQAVGHQTGQQDIERRFELIEVMELPSQVAQHGDG